MAKFTVYTDKHNAFRWKFIASNNVVVAKSGESYQRQEDCLASLGLLQKDIGGAPVGYQLRKGTQPVTASQAASAPGVVLAPSTAAHQAGTVNPALLHAPSTPAHPAVAVHPANTAAPAAAPSLPVHTPPAPPASPMSVEQFAPPRI